MFLQSKTEELASLFTVREESTVSQTPIRKSYVSTIKHEIWQVSLTQGREYSLSDND